MPRIAPFRAVHFDFARHPLARGLCPPYDVIAPSLARRLRGLAHNAIHLELPGGRGNARYRRAARTWERWRREGALVRDPEPAFYVVRQDFALGGRRLRRTGLMAALGLEAAGLRRVIAHERTLSKPKRDRLHLLKALRVNTSPVFLLYSDPRGSLRRRLRTAMRRRPEARGLGPEGVEVRLWRVRDRGALRAVRASFRAKTLLVADGHHRLEVARRAGLGSILCYLCAEQDPGLVVLPTHRMLARGRLEESLRGLCRMTPVASLERLERALARHPSHTAFGVASRRGVALAVPVSSGRNGGRGPLAVEWLAKRALANADPHEIRYTHESREAAAWARAGGLALLVRSVSVKDIRRAVSRSGLLPQKTTFFFPKVEAGIVFKEAD